MSPESKAVEAATSEEVPEVEAKASEAKDSKKKASRPTYVALHNMSRGRPDAAPGADFQALSPGDELTFVDGEEDHIQELLASGVIALKGDHKEKLAAADAAREAAGRQNG